MAAILMANRAVTNVEDQPPPIRFRCDDGKLREHTFDFRATYFNGRRIAIAVKPKSDVVKSGIRQVLRHVRPLLGGFADEAILLTDEIVTLKHGWNACSILRARRARNHEDCARMRDFFRGVHGAVHISQVAVQFDNPAAALNAIWCLVYDGVLKLVFPDQKLVDAPYVINAKTTL
ncbi:hypothetical protein LAC81_28925 [Ensifer adhaerens]|uniref:hypothetical protein n=1 Tax=Ensifer adhaerens TaxID=106592 RepID=UPI001CBD4E0C|nr:hypothetical protein [Ensifer adhaerens]MBZ7924764.1 hypothetical protein [Ensifer adhaerens]UAX96013.1 hypothetical protein LAC78_34905 [Ensifer adhaerens]UAY04646.1 hypothetical protein LAC80_25405 [Ensifer adhaerens]UAY10077.1 hypothetical protein LAC81_28925 [Ensifer adhaerens]